MQYLPKLVQAGATSSTRSMARNYRRMILVTHLCLVQTLLSISSAPPAPSLASRLMALISRRTGMRTTASTTYGCRVEPRLNRRAYENGLGRPFLPIYSISWPGCLDNSVAGGITTGDSPLETIIRECGESCSCLGVVAVNDAPMQPKKPRYRPIL